MTSTNEPSTTQTRTSAPLFGTLFGALITISVSVAITFTTTLIVQNQFFDSEGGWTLQESSISTESSVDIDADLKVSALEVAGDIRVTGSELQFEGSTCTEAAPLGETWICFDGNQLLASQNEDPYGQIAGTQGEQGPQGDTGPPGEKGDQGESGGTARIWVSDADILEPLGFVAVVGSGFEPNEQIDLWERTPDGDEFRIAAATANAGGGVLWTLDGGLEYVGDGVYTLVARNPGTELTEEDATFPIPLFLEA